MQQAVFSHVGISCAHPIELEKFYVKHFGFKRARVYAPGAEQVVMLKSGDVYLELFQATEPATMPKPQGSGPDCPGWKHICFTVENLDAKLQELKDEVQITLGPADMGSFVENMKVCWVSDPEGNIIELNQGYRDEVNPPEIE